MPAQRHFVSSESQRDSEPTLVDLFFFFALPFGLAWAATEPEFVQDLLRTSRGANGPQEVRQIAGSIMLLIELLLLCKK